MTGSSINNTSTTAELMSSGQLPVMEHFYTIQGEGYHQGRAAYFIRLAGCDVGCVWCDVKESWDASAHPLMKIDEIVKAVKQTPAQMAVITGGEPLMYELGPLTDALHRAGIETAIETSGAYPLSGTWDWICLSPKKFKEPLQANIPLANELKVIIYNRSDFDWAEKYAGMTASHCRLYLQPEWEKSEEMTPLIVDHIRKNPKWNLSLQIHKFIHVP